MMLHQWAGIKQVKKTVHVCPSTKFIYNRMGNSRLSFYLQEYKVILYRPSSLRYGYHIGAGPTTLSITTFSITTFSITTLSI